MLKLKLQTMDLPLNTEVEIVEVVATWGVGARRLEIECDDVREHLFGGSVAIVSKNVNISGEAWRK